MNDLTRCPRCDSDDVAPIGYGPPTPDLVEILAAGGYHQVDGPWFEGAPN